MLVVAVVLIGGAGLVWALTQSDAPPVDPMTGKRTVHEEGDGPLSANVGGGGQAAAVPGPPPWSASFGSFLLCSTKPGAEITIEDVRFDTPTKPLKLEAWFRLVPEASKRGDANVSWDPIAFTVGTHGHHAGTGPPAGGTFTRALDRPITQPCDDLGGDSARTELITEMTVGAAGGHVSTTYIDYRVDGHPYTLVVRWVNIACGNQISADTGFCQKDRRKR